MKKKKNIICSRTNEAFIIDTIKIDFSKIKEEYHERCFKLLDDVIII